VCNFVQDFKGLKCQSEPNSQPKASMSVYVWITGHFGILQLSRPDMCWQV